MKDLKEYIIEQCNKDSECVYVVYLSDNTMYNYYKDEKEANDEADKLNKEAQSNKAVVKKEPMSNFEKK